MFGFPSSPSLIARSRSASRSGLSFISAITRSSMLIIFPPSEWLMNRPVVTITQGLEVAFLVSAPVCYRANVVNDNGGH